MLLKCRTETEELLAMQYLHIRSELTEKEKVYHQKLEKGYQGEVRFDELAECLQEERYILNDLLFEVNNSYFQIDSLIISQGVIHLLDIKNFKGDYYLKSDKLYSVTSDWEYKNPLDQLKRSVTLFGQLLQSLKLNYLVEPFVIFINPEFTLYQAPIDQPIIFPTQVNRFLQDLNKTPSKLNDTHNKLAQKLLSLHQPKNPFSTLPKYNYDQLKKGVYCRTCHRFELIFKHSGFICKKCGEYEKAEAAILRNVKEFNLLFPERMITTNNLYDWCTTDLNKKTIYRTLKKNYQAFGKTRDTYYK